MIDKLNTDILSFLDQKGERGADLRLIVLHLGSRAIEESVEKSVNEIIGALNNLIENGFIERISLENTDSAYRTRRLH
jgi:endonuclease IV